MDADIKILEEKITQLVTVCGALQGENAKLRDDLTQAKKDSAALKTNMEKASVKLEGLLESFPQSEEVA